MTWTIHYYELFYYRYRYVVYKLDDEWFYVIVSDYRFDKFGIHRYYKCDQIDGLIDCLKMLKDKYEN